MATSTVALLVATALFLWGLKDDRASKPVSMISAKWFLAAIAFGDAFIPSGRYGPTVQMVIVLAALFALVRYQRSASNPPSSSGTPH